MNTAYWNLFWTTGLPEAWLMNRNREAPKPSGGQPGSGRRPDGALAFPQGLPGGVPGDPGKTC